MGTDSCIWLVTSWTGYSKQTPKTSTLFSGQYLRNHWTLDIVVLGSIDIVWPKQHSPVFRSFPPGTPCINVIYLDQIVSRFKKSVTIRESTESESLLLLCESLQQSVQLQTACSVRDLVLMFIFILRTLGVKARLIISFRPLPLKPSNQDLCINNKRRKNENQRWSLVNVRKVRAVLRVMSVK